MTRTLCNVTQFVSQVRQVWFFKDIFPLSRLALGMLRFPFEYSGQAGNASSPLAVNMLVTSQCNLHCQMCSFNAQKFSPDGKELTLEEIKGFLSRISKKKLHIFLSGGEPFTRPDIFDIIGHINELKLNFGICTNGTLLTEEKAERLLRSKPAFIIFSLHGDRELHDSITGMQGSFDKLITSIKMMRAGKKRPKVLINCAVSPANIGNLLDVARISDESGADMLRFEHLNFISEENAIKQAQVSKKIFPDDEIDFSTFHFGGLEESRCLSAIKNVISKRKDFRIPIYFKPYLSDREIASWYSGESLSSRKCFFIWRSFYVASNGDIFPCQFLLYKMGNVLSDDLDTIWNGKKYREFRLQMKKGLMPLCSRCCKL